MISTKIKQMIKVADTLGAPRYDLDTLCAAAVAIEAKLAEVLADIVTAFEADTSDLDSDLATIDAGARQAFGWIVGQQMLPADLDSMIDREDGADKPLGVAWRVARKYL